MQRRIPLLLLGVSVLAAALACLASNARCRSLDSILNAADKADLDSLALRTAQKIINADRTEPKPGVLVVDFLLGSPGVSSNLGTLLADRLSDSLRNSSKKLNVIDRKDFAEYLTENWTTLEDLRNFPGCLHIGREFVVTSEGKPDSIYVLKGAPFGLTARAIADVRSWKFKPAQKDGTPVLVCVPVEITS